MKILIYTGNHLPALGGRELVVHNLALQYQRLGHYVAVVGPGGWWSHRRFRSEYPVWRWSRIPLLSFEGASTVHLLRTQALHRFDVVHAHNTYPYGYVATRLKSYLRCPILITPHGGDINVVPEIGFGIRLNPAIDTKVRAAVARADYVTAISETVFQSLLGAGAPETKIVRIANGVDVDRFQTKQDVDVFKYLGVPLDSRLVVTIANYRPVKGHEVLVDALRIARLREPRLRLVIVGRTSATFCERVRAEGMSEYVKFTGILKLPTPGGAEPDVLAAILQAAEVYASASVGEGAEGLSLAMLEAMAAGCCVVATDISGNRDFVKDRVNGLLVKPGSAEEMADALIEICADDEAHARYRRAAPDAVKGFRWSDVAVQYLALYERAIRERRSLRETVGASA